MIEDSEQRRALERLRGIKPGEKHLFVPQLVTDTIALLLEGRRANVVCDPWAGIGIVASVAARATRARQVYAFTRIHQEASAGRDVLRGANWRVGDPIELMNELDGRIDVAVSILPSGVPSELPISVRTNQGETQFKGKLDSQILVAVAKRLSQDGMGIFLVAPSFFLHKQSLLTSLASIGIGVEAAFGFPSGTFAPFTNSRSYLVVIRNFIVPKMFVAQLSTDRKINIRIISNYKKGLAGWSLELGRYIDPLSFKGLDEIKFRERYARALCEFGAPAIKLGELATAIKMGQYGDKFAFPAIDNAIFIPIIGVSDVVLSAGELRLKKQNYAQVGIDPNRSHAEFVAHFLNSELGKELREARRTGTVIPKLNKQSLGELDIVVPSLETQSEVLALEAEVAADQNTLMGLQNQLRDYRRTLWTHPRSVKDVADLIHNFSNRLSGLLKQQASANLQDWTETLPFPLASILRAWYATPVQDYKTKNEHLLHFFEAAAEFVSVVLLSAFISNDAVFKTHKGKLVEILNRQNLSYARATFGVWKVTVEYLGRQTRLLLSEVGKKPEEAVNDRALCAEIFADPSLLLPVSLSGVEVADVISKTNKMRNDWSGHSGLAGHEESHLRNEHLLMELHRFREAMGDTWSHVQLIRAQSCKPRRSVFENDVAVLSGSNPEFLKETRQMSIWLDVEQLYLASKDAERPLRLLPLVKVGPSPKSAMNACYFFSRLEEDGARYVSYHFQKEPEMKTDSSDVVQFINSLEEPS